MDGVNKLLITKKNDPHLICGLYNGRVEARRLSDLRTVASIRLISYITCMVELEDGTLLLSTSKELKRWDRSQGTVRAIPNSIPIVRMIELRPNVIVSVTDSSKAIKIWRLTTSECLHYLTKHKSDVIGLEKLKTGYFVTALRDETIRVWDESGVNVATYQTDCHAMEMTVAMGSIVVGWGFLSTKLEIRRP